MLATVTVGGIHSKHNPSAAIVNVTVFKLGDKTRSHGLYDMPPSYLTLSDNCCKNAFLVW